MSQHTYNAKGQFWILDKHLVNVSNNDDGDVMVVVGLGVNKAETCLTRQWHATTGGKNTPGRGKGRYKILDKLEEDWHAAGGKKNKK